MRSTVVCTLLLCTFAAGAADVLQAMCAQDPTAHPDCHRTWTSQEWADHWDQYCAWFPETAGCSDAPVLDDAIVGGITNHGVVPASDMPDGLGLASGDGGADKKLMDALGLPAVQDENTGSLLSALGLGASGDDDDQFASNLFSDAHVVAPTVPDEDGNVDFTLFSGAWSPSVVDLSQNAREDVKWLNPDPQVHKYIQVMMDCSQWHKEDATVCNTRGMLKFIDMNHNIVSTSPASQMCDSRRHNDWINSYITKLPKNTHNIIAFAEGQGGKQCGPVYFTTKLLSQNQFDSAPNMFTLPADLGTLSRRTLSVSPNANTLTAEVVCADGVLTLPTWCRKGGTLSVVDAEGNALIGGTSEYACDSDDPTKAEAVFSVDLPREAVSVVAHARKIESDAQDCGRVRFLVRTWRDPNKTEPPSPAPTPAPTPIRAGCTHMRCFWNGQYIHVRHQTEEWGTSHRCERDEHSPTGCTCRCYQ